MATSPTFGPPPPYTNNAALQELWPQIAQAAHDNGVNPNVAYAQAVAEGGINSDGSLNTSPTGAVGVFQLEPATSKMYNVDPNNNTQNIGAGMQYMGQLLTKYQSNSALALAAYNAGPVVVNDYINGTNNSGKNPNHEITGGIPPFRETQNYIAKITNQAGNPSGAMANSSPADVKDLNRTATPYTDIKGNDVDNDTFNSLTPDIIVNTGLDILPWYQDSDLVTGNPRLRQEVQPVTFKIHLQDFYLSSGVNPATLAQSPLELQLNASMKSYSLAMKHMFHQQRTRTAFHITMWGMQADIIEGQCTTGVFMNQFGLTDLYSTLNPNEKMKQLLTSGFTFPDAPLGPAAQAVRNQAQGLINRQTGAVVGGAVGATQVTDADINTATLLSKVKTTENKAFRVAAQDAFQEFLSLFRMNGNVWLYNKAYQNNVGENRTWQHTEAWSPTLGLNSQQENSRNNDVILRGSVVMQFRNFVYEGYFKSMQWTMDASSPYAWNFNFTFQVERTIGREYVPEL